MHFLVISLRKDWARMRRDPFSLATSLGIPLVLAVMMSLVFGHEPATPQGRLLIADEDASVVSNLLTSAFGRDPLGKMLVVETVDRQTGRARIDRGDASAFLIIPKGLQQAVILNQPCQLQLFTNPSERILPQIVEQTLSIAVDAAFYVQHVAGAQLRALSTTNAPPDQLIAQTSVTFSHLAANLTKYVNPPLIGLETAVVQQQQQPLNFAAIFLPSMVFMGLLFIAGSLAGDIWKERVSGTLRRLASSPVSMFAYLAGRLVFVALFYCIVAIVGLVAAQRLAGMPVPNLPLAILWMTFVGTVFYLLFLWIVMQPATQRAANVLSNLIIFPLSMLGGCFFPFEWMPAWMVHVGKLTPNGWALSQFKQILAGTATPAALTASAAALAAVAALAFLFTLRRLRHTFAI